MQSQPQRLVPSSSGQCTVPLVYVSSVNDGSSVLQSSSQTEQRFYDLEEPSVQLIIPSPPPSQNFIFKDCFVRLKRLTCREIEQRIGRRYVIPLPPPPPRGTPGKQLHLLKRSRGRPRKAMNNGQCVVTSSSKSMMKLKIVKVSGNASQCSSLMEEQSPLRRNVDIEAGNAAAAILVESGYFDQVLMEKSANAKKSTKKIMPTRPRKNDRTTTVTVTSNYPCTPFSSRSLFLDENKPGATCEHKVKKTQSNTCGTVTTTVNPMSFKKTTPSKGVALHPKPVVNKSKKSSREQDHIKVTQVNYVSSNELTSDDGTSWVNELFSTCLASEVVQEALDDFYIPDISFIQNLTKDDEVAVPTSTKVPSSTSELCSSTNLVSSSAMKSKEHYEIIDITSPNERDEESELLTAAPCEAMTPEERLQKLELYEHLFKNDIIMIHPEDDELPLPY